MEFTDVIKRRKMVRAFTGEPLPPGTAERLLRAANRAPSAGFSQGYSFLVLEGHEQAAPLWEIFYQDAPSAGDEAYERAQIAALSRAPLVIVTLACKDADGTPGHTDCPAGRRRVLRAAASQVRTQV